MGPSSPTGSDFVYDGRTGFKVGSGRIHVSNQAPRRFDAHRAAVYNGCSTGSRKSSREIY